MAREFKRIEEMEIDELEDLLAERMHCSKSQAAYMVGRIYALGIVESVVATFRRRSALLQ